MKSIGNTLKELREKSNLTIKDVEKALNDRGVKISNKTIYGWERERSTPNVDIFMILCDIYNCNDILSYFGYKDISNNNLSKETPVYKNLLIKYENLDEKGQHTVNTVLEIEYNRCQDEQATTKEIDYTKIDISHLPENIQKQIVEIEQRLKIDSTKEDNKQQKIS